MRNEAKCGRTIIRGLISNQLETLSVGNVKHDMQQFYERYSTPAVPYQFWKDVSFVS